jgi:hypothetical protein
MLLEGLLRQSLAKCLGFPQLKQGPFGRGRWYSPYGCVIVVFVYTSSS